nr:hypothetical protein [Tanacetum cinerariifolium]
MENVKAIACRKSDRLGYFKAEANPRKVLDFATSNSNWLEGSMISSANERVSIEALRLYAHAAGIFAFPYLAEPFDETLWNHLQMDFCNFMKKPGKTPSFSVRPADQPINVGSPSVNHLKAVVDNDQVESYSILKDKDASGLELAIFGEGFSWQNADVTEGFKKRRSITKALEEKATLVRPFAGDNSSRPVPKKRKPKGLRKTNTRGSVPLLPTTALMGVGKHPRMAAVGNMLTNESQIISRDHTKLKDNFVTLKSSQIVMELMFENARNLEESSMLKVVAAFAKESQKILSEELEGLKPHIKEAERLGQRCQDLESERDSLLKEAEKLVDLSSKLKMAAVGNMLTNESQIISRDHTKLKDNFVALKSSQIVMELRFENARNLEESSMLKVVAAFAKESQKILSEELEGLKPRIKEAERLGQRCQDLESERDSLLKEAEKVVDLSSKLKVADLEKANLVNDLLSLAVKKLFESEHFNHALGDLQQKAITFAEKIFDEAAEAFYKLKCPYISLLVEKAGQSFKELAAVKPPSF